MNGAWRYDALSPDLRESHSPTFASCCFRAVALLGQKAATLCPSVRLEAPFQSKLNFPLVVRQRGADGGSSALIRIVIRELELRVIGDVEELGTEAQSMVFG